MGNWLLRSIYNQNKKTTKSPLLVRDGKLTLTSAPYTKKHESLAANHFLLRLRNQSPILKTSQTGSYETDQKTNNVIVKKPRVLCLHGFRTSGDILKKQLEIKWPKQLLEKMDLVFADGPFLAGGKSDFEGIFDPPYYEWFQFKKEYNEYTNFEDCELVNLEQGVAYVEDYMINNGPFDGLFGFSQGAALSAVLLGLQEKRLALTKILKVKFGILIGGARLKHLPPIDVNAFSSPIQCPTLHILGKRDNLRPYSLKLLETCVDSVTIHHRKGHTIPGLDNKDLLTVLSFIKKIAKDLA